MTVASQKQACDLEFFFSADRLFFRSTFGAQLERAAARRRSSDGRAIGGTKPSWAWRPNGEPPPVYVNETRGEGASYEVDHSDLVMHSRLSRRMRVLCWLNPEAYAVLSVYFGDRGARWAQTSQNRLDSDGGDTVSPGLGFGAIVALYPLTPSGRQLLDRERRRGVGNATTQKATRAEERRRASEHASRLAYLDAAIQESEREEASLMLALEQALLAKKEARARLQAAKESGDSKAVHAAQTLLKNATRAARRAAEAHEEGDRALSLLRRHRAHSAAPTTLPQPEPPPEAHEAHAAIREIHRKHGQACAEAEATGEEEPAAPLLPGVPAARTPVVVPRVGVRAELTEDELLEVALLLQRTSPTESRRLLLDRAHEQAEELLRSALSAWNLTARETARQ